MTDLRKEEEYDPHFHRTTTKPTTYFDTLSHFLKGSIGSGILAMPMAFKNAGLYFGVFLTILVSLIVLYCVHILVNSSHIICKRLKMPQIDFGQVAEKAVECGPERLQKYSTVAKHVTNAILISNLLGLCIVYVIFVAVNLQDLIEQYADVKWNIRLCILLTLIGFLPVNMIRELKYLVPFSWLANVLLFTGLITTFVLMCLGEFAYDTMELDYIAPPSSWPMFLGTVVFALEAIAIVLPLENKMKNPAGFVSPFGVVNVGLVITMIMYILIGFMGYFKYGPDIKASVTMNLTASNLAEEIVITTVKIIITIAIFLTYCIQFYGFMDITKHAFDLHNHPVFKEYFIRVGVIIGTVLVAIALPDLGPFITLVGALCLSVAGLILPPIIECIVFWNEPGMGKFNWRLWKNGLLVTFGFLAMISGTVVSIIEFINLAKNRENQ